MLGLRPISTAPLATQISAVTGDYTLTITSASVVITGQTVTLRIGRQLAVTAASVPVTGQTITLRRGYSLTVTAASVPVTGQTVTLRIARKLILTVASVPVTGQSVTLRVARQLAVTAASVPISGQSVGLRVTRQLAVTAATVPITGQTVSLRISRQLAVSAASVVISGQTVSLTYTPAAGAFTLDITSATVAIVGQTVTLTYTPAAGATAHVDSGSRPAKGRKARRIRLDEAGLPNPEAVALVQEMLASVSRETVGYADNERHQRQDQDLARRLAEEHEIVVRQLMAQTPATLDLGALLEHARSLDGQVKQLLAAASSERALSGNIDSDASDDDDLILLLME
jgi:hypothetical protein